MTRPAKEHHCRSFRRKNRPGNGALTRFVSAPDGAGSSAMPPESAGMPGCLLGGPPQPRHGIGWVANFWRGRWSAATYTGAPYSAYRSAVTRSCSGARCHGLGMGGRERGRCLGQSLAGPGGENGQLVRRGLDVKYRGPLPRRMKHRELSISSLSTISLPPL